MSAKVNNSPLKREAGRNDQQKQKNDVRRKHIFNKVVNKEPVIIRNAQGYLQQYVTSGRRSDKPELNDFIAKENIYTFLSHVHSIRERHHKGDAILDPVDVAYMKLYQSISSRGKKSFDSYIDKMMDACCKLREDMSDVDSISSESYYTKPQMAFLTPEISMRDDQFDKLMTLADKLVGTFSGNSDQPSKIDKLMDMFEKVTETGSTAEAGINKAAEVMDSIKGVTDPIGGIFNTFSNMFSLGSVGANTAAFAGVALLISFAKSYDSWKTEYIVIKILVALYCLFLCWKYKDELYGNLKGVVQKLVDMVSSLFTKIKDDDDEENDLTMETVETKAQNLGFDMSTIDVGVDLLLAGLGLTALVDPKEKSSFLTTVSKTVGTRQSLTDYIRSIVSIVTNLVNKLSSKIFKTEGLITLMSGEIAIDSVLERIAKFLDEANTGKLRYTNTNLEKMQALYSEASSVYQLTPMNKFTSNGVNLLRKALNELHALIKQFQASNLGLAGYKMDPVWVNLSGKPCIQKTVIVNILAAHAVKQHVSAEDWEIFKKNPDAFICNRISENGHWEGYDENAVAVIWDDFLQKRSFLGDTADAALEMIRAKNTFSFPLLYAGMENKGKRFFRAPAIFTTTNRPTFQVETIVSQEALLRRIDIDLVVTIKMEYTKDPTKTGIYERDLDMTKLQDHDKLSKEVDLGVFEFHRRENGVIVEVLDFDQVLGLYTSYYNKHKAYLEANTALFNKMYKKFEEGDTVLVKDLDGNKTSTKYDSDFPFRGLEVEEFTVKRLSDEELLTGVKFYEAKAQMGPPVPDNVDPNMFDDYESMDRHNYCFEDEIARNRQRLKEYEERSRSSNGGSIMSSHISPVPPPPSAAESFATASSMTSYTEDEISEKLKSLGLNKNLIKRVKLPSSREYDRYFSNKFTDKWMKFTTSHLLNFNQLRSIVIPYIAGELAWYSGKADFFCAVYANHSEENFAILVALSMGVNPDHLSIPYVEIDMPAYKKTKDFDIPVLSPIWNALVFSYSFLKYKSKEFLNRLESSDVIILLGSIPTCYLVYKFFFAKRTFGAKSQSAPTASRGNTKAKVKTRTMKELKSKFTRTKPQGRDLNGDDIANNIYRHNVWSIRFSPNSNQDFEHAGYILGIKGHIAMIPKHFISAWTSEAKKDIFYPEIELRLFCGDIHKASIKMGDLMDCAYDIDVDNCDIAFLKLPRGFPMFKDISGKFVSERDLSVLTGDFTGLLSSPYRKTSIICPASMSRLNVVYRIDDEEYMLTRSIKYEGLTEEGDCGAPLIARVERLGNRRVLGIHVSALDLEGVGFCTIITQEILELCTDLINETSDTTVFTVPQFKDVVIENTFEVLGGDPEGRINNTGNWTEIRKSPLHGCHEYHIPKTAPAMLRTKIRDEIEINPYHVMLTKYKCEPVSLNIPILKRSIEDLESFLVRYSTKNHNFRLLTLQEAVYGIPGTEIKSMNPSSSVGFPYKITHPKLKNHLFYSYERNGANPGLPILQELVDSMILAFKRRERPLIIFTDNLKDERRSIEKVRLGATRGFNGAPIDFCSAFKIYFGTFIEWMTLNKIKNGCAVGVNAYSKEWHIIFNYLYHRNVRGGDGDYAGFDGSLLAMVIYEICEMIIRIIADPNEENNEIRRKLFDEIMFARHMYFDTIYEQHAGNPSGNPFTTFLNCLYNLIAFRYCFYSNQSLWNERFFDHVTLYVLGDDNIWSASEAICDKFNQFTLSENMSKLGLRYTTADKSAAVEATRPIKDLEFLKRGFLYCEERGLWIAPLKLDVVLEICQWSKKSMYTQIFISNVSETLKELSLHGDEVFEKFRILIKKFFSDLGMSYENIPEMYDSHRFVRDKVMNSHFIV